MTFRPQTFILNYLLLPGTLIFIFSCNNFKKNRSHESVSSSSIANGKQLAATYCQSCHMLPDPSLLDSKSWENGVLPNMGPRLGIFKYGTKYYPSGKNDFNIRRDFYPAKPLMSEQEWQSIIDYYSSVSPDSLPGPKGKYPIKVGEALFKIETPQFRQGLPTTCFVQIDSSLAFRQLVISDLITRNIYRYNGHLSLVDSFKNISPVVVVDIEKDTHGFIACNMGEMKPNNAKYGSAVFIAANTQGKMKTDSSMNFGNLARPVQISPADFNVDNKTDYLVCEYGDLIGALSWMENLGNNKYERHVIREVPGAIKAYIRDVNKDGLPDIWVLFAQGDESIILFTNKGQGKFAEERVLRFPAVYGSSYFEMADFNKDGYPDIVYTCGDNADYSAVLKPYHGIYIFMNDGKNHFQQQSFYPMNGCFKAMARDFDGDGDLDIAAISFFADYAKHPEESFIYLENKDNFKFQPYSIPGSNKGRWLTMDAGDIDGDGKIDLVLGNFSIAPAFIKSAEDWKNGPPFIVLKNSIKK